MCVCVYRSIPPCVRWPITSAPRGTAATTSRQPSPGKCPVTSAAETGGCVCVCVCVCVICVPCVCPVCDLCAVCVCVCVCECVCLCGCVCVGVCVCVCARSERLARDTA